MAPSAPVGSGPTRPATRQRLAIAGAATAVLVLAGALLVAVQLTSSLSPTPTSAGTPTSNVPATPTPWASSEPSPESPSNGQDTRAVAPSPSGPADTGADRDQAPAPNQPAPAPTTPKPPPDDPGDSSGGPWSTIVDNDSSRFSASGNWKTSSNSSQRYGSNFRYASPVEASDPAWYRVDIPATGDYRVDVWFPAKSGYNERTPYIVATTSGNQTVHISQQSGGGSWVNLGTFELSAGDADVVAVSRWRTAGTGYVIADAIRITET